MTKTAAPALGRRAETVATLLSWLYCYSVLWLAGYAVLAVMVFGWKPIVITGASMEPLIDRGDLVLLHEPAATDDPVGRGTVITYAQPGRPDQLVTHRVTAVESAGYRTRGDANAVEDSDVVPTADVVGVGRLLVPVLGRPLVWLRGGDLVPFSAWLVLTVAAAALATRPTPGSPKASAPEPVPPAQPIDVPASELLGEPYADAVVPDSQQLVGAGRG